MDVQDADAQQPQAASSDDCGQYIDDAMNQLQREAAHNIQLRMRQMSESEWHINAEDIVVEVQLHGTISEAVEAQRTTKMRLWRNSSSSDTQTVEIAMWQPPYDIAMRDGEEVKVQDDTMAEEEAQERTNEGEEDGARMIGAMSSVVTSATNAMQADTRSVQAAIEAAIEWVEKVVNQHHAATTMIAEHNNAARATAARSAAAACRMQDEMATKAGMEMKKEEKQAQQQHEGGQQAATWWQWIGATNRPTTMMVARAMTAHGEWEKADEGREWIGTSHITRISPIEVDENQRTALHLAVRGGQEEVAATLIARYSDAAITMQNI